MLRPFPVWRRPGATHRAARWHMSLCYARLHWLPVTAPSLPELASVWHLLAMQDARTHATGELCAAFAGDTLFARLVVPFE